MLFSYCSKNPPEYIALFFQFSSEIRETPNLGQTEKQVKKKRKIPSEKQAESLTKNT